MWQTVKLNHLPLLTVLVVRLGSDTLAPGGSERADQDGVPQSRWTNGALYSLLLAATERTRLGKEFVILERKVGIQDSGPNTQHYGSARKDSVPTSFPVISRRQLAIAVAIST